MLRRKYSQLLKCSFDQHTNALSFVAVGLLTSVLLCGCTAVVHPVLSTGAVHIRGVAQAGQRAVMGANLQLYASGDSSVSQKALPLLSHVERTDEAGNFDFVTTPACTSADSIVYLVASGGSVQAGASNDSLGMLAILGTCEALAKSSFVTLNEVTTLASLGPLSPYTDDADAVSLPPELDRNTILEEVNALANMQDGTSLAQKSSDLEVGLTAKIHSLSNLLSTCNTSSGGAAGDGTPCGVLFSQTTFASQASPKNTIQAALSIARHPDQQVNALYSLSSAGKSFAPALPAPPVNWSLKRPLYPATPVFSPLGGSYKSGQIISMAESTAGATIHYTTDASAPGLHSAVYSGPLTLSHSIKLKAIAIRSGLPSNPAYANYTLTQPIAVQLTPGEIALGPSQAQLLRAMVSGTTQTGVTFTLNPAVGSISANGTYSAPSAITAPQTISVSAQSIADPSKSASALIYLIPRGSASTTYFVDNANGKDSNTGKNVSAAFASVGRINSLQLLPGDTVAFRSGQEWHEMLTVKQSGTQGLPITYTSYGSGSQPVLSAADNVSGWTQGKGSLVQEACPTQSFCSGFEAGGPLPVDWDGLVNNNDTSITSSNAVVAHGSYSLALTSSAGTDDRAWVTKRFTPSSEGSNRSFRFSINTPAGSLKPNSSFRSQLDSASGQIGFISFITNAKGNVSSIGVYDTSDNTDVIPSTAVGGYVMGQWNTIEVDLQTSKSTGKGALFLNGVQMDSTSSLSIPAFVGISEIQLGNTAFGGAIAAGSAIYFDDFQTSSNSTIGLANTGLSTQIWHRPQASDPKLINFSGQAGTPRTSYAAIGSPYQFAWDGSTLYVYSLQDPGSTVEVPQRPSALTAPGASYISLQGLEFRGGQTYDVFCGYRSVSCDHWRFEGDTFNAGYSNELYFQTYPGTAASGPYVHGSVFKGGGSNGIAMANAGGTGAWIVGNEFYDLSKIYNVAYDQNAFSDAIEGYSTTGTDGAGTYVAFNLIHDIGVGLPQAYGGGIHPDTVVGWMIEHNTIQNTNGSGVELEKGSGHTAQYNLMVNAGLRAYSSGLMIRGGDGDSVSNMIAQYNTSVGGWWACSLLVEQNQGTVTARNIALSKNICVNASSGTQFYADQGATGRTNLIDSNGFGVAQPNFLVFAGSVWGNYPDFDSAVGSSTGSIQGDPLFVNPDANLYTLKAGSPASGIGAFSSH